MIPPCGSPVRPVKSCQMSMKLPQIDFTRKMNFLYLYKKCLKMWAIKAK